MQYYITGRPLKSSACCILQASRAQNWFQFLENQFGSLWLKKSLIMSSPFLLTSHHPVLPSLTQPARPPLWSPHHLPGDKWLSPGLNDVGDGWRRTVTAAMRPPCPFTSGVCVFTRGVCLFTRFTLTSRGVSHTKSTWKNKQTASAC